MKRWKRIYKDEQEYEEVTEQTALIALAKCYQDIDALLATAKAGEEYQTQYAYYQVM